MSEKRRSCIDSILDKEFQYHYFLLTNVQLHHLLENDWRQLDGYTACYCEPYCFGCGGVYGLALQRKLERGSALADVVVVERVASRRRFKLSKVIIWGDTL